MFNKEILRTITHSWDRFIAIFLIVALGVGFYSGLRMTAPNMRASADQFFDRANLMDIRVVSTLGLSESNLDAIREVEGVAEVMPAYETDVVAEIDAEPYVMRVHSLAREDEPSLNEVELVEGRMPSANDECVLSYDRIMVKPVNIGDTVKVTQGQGELEDTLVAFEFKVVGLVHTPYYASSASMGSSSLGGGLVQQAMYVQPSTFAEDFPVTEAFITVTGARELNSSSAKYDELIGEVSDRLNELALNLAPKRTTEVREEAQQKLDEKKAEYESERADAYAKLDDAKRELSDAARKLQDSESDLKSGQKKLASGESELNSQKASADAQFAAAQAEIDAKRAQLDTLPVVPPGAKEQLDAAQAELDAKKAATKKQLDAAQSKLNSSRNELDSAPSKITDGWIKYEEGMAEYKENLAKADSEFADAKKKLDDAQADIDDIKEAEWLVMDRSKNYGAEAFDLDAGRVDNIAQVFPFVFFLVAALVALTTMTRMVDEERMQIGTLKALGYSRARITSKYLIYAALASIFGSALGIFALSFSLPAIIMSAYSIMYIVPTGKMVLDIGVVAIASGLGVAITLISTTAAALSTLRESPAALMLPPTPKAGKPIMLERIKPLWSHLTFLWKVTCRNIFRYKKRLFMTIIGIAGCTALLLTGFGLRDSINDIIDKHYGQIIDYSIVFTTEDDITPDERMAVMTKLEDDPNVQVIAETSYEAMKSVGASTGKTSPVNLTVEVIVPSNPAEFEKLWNFRNRTSGARVDIGESGAVITEKLAIRYDLAPGDKVTLAKQDSMGNPTREVYDIPVSGVIENYVGHDVFLTASEYEEIFDEAPAYNTLYVKASGDEAERDALKDEVGKLAGVKTMANNSETINQYKTALKSVDMVVWVLIIAAALLAFIVLYNLTNINITERTREIATLKVLGFTAAEIDKYIFREILLLSILGALFGLALGTWLENFVVVTAEVDAVMFGREIHVPSYIYSFVLTMLFTFIVAIAMRRKVKRIDMVESLKSNE